MRTTLVATGVRKCGLRWQSGAATPLLDGKFRGRHALNTLTPTRRIAPAPRDLRSPERRLKPRRAGGEGDRINSFANQGRDPIGQDLGIEGQEDQINTPSSSAWDVSKVNPKWWVSARTRPNPGKCFTVGMRPDSSIVVQ